MKHLRFFALALLLWFLLSGLLLLLGSSTVAPRAVIAALFHAERADATTRGIVRLLRLPRVLTATLAGAALAAAGLQLQTLFRNPLAGPFLLGIDAGAGLGVALVIISLGGTTGIEPLLAASIGATVMLLLMVAAATAIPGVVGLLLVGLLGGFAARAVINILLVSSASEELRLFLHWSAGSFGGVSPRQLLPLTAAIAIGLLLALAQTTSLNALSVGEEYARSVGIALRPTRIALIASVALLAGPVTAFCGPVAFIGVIAPHATRALLGSADHSRLLPGSLLCGAILALAAELIASVPGSPLRLPLNSLTALVGAPAVAIILVRMRAYSRL